MSIQTIGVIGAGTMGSGIAQVAALSGYRVILRDVDEGALERGAAAIRSSLTRVLQKTVADEASRNEQLDRTIERIAPTSDWQKLEQADLVVEAVFESFEAKRDVFALLGRICRPEAILATNTSSISITRLAAASGRADRFIGMHFMNPVPVMKLVEIIRGIATSDATYQATRQLAAALGKTPVEVHDFPGFVSNRLLMPMINEAVFALMEGVGSVESIDTVMQLGMNHPMGPLRLADLIGLDVCLAIMEVLFDGFRDSKYRPCPLLRKMVDAGYLGKKSGRGFYVYAQ
jgi:3-hydroxybutyryl-CoA dehydrogenase